MDSTRELAWDGLVNVRDLGGLPVANGRRTKFHQVVRSDHPSRATLNGWEAIRGYGIRTVISFETINLSPERNAQENPPLCAPEFVAGIRHLRLPVQDASDREYMRAWADTGLWGTPLFFGDALQKWPDFYVDILNAIADAEGTVLLHCGRGHDRTGIVVALLLSLIGVPNEAVILDYMHDSVQFASAAPDAHANVHSALESAALTLEETFEVISSPDTVKSLRDAGLTQRTIETLRRKLI